ncbi:hypothetical protein L210DRAFT_2268991 [Boletus edulis BED1]|uniref:DUF6534 domain-containing protein n=1 Tax=Boletus edulis BED1 TaxID=1328754 RepID=A0AAD4BSB4_BOLED|nr:hypothetical protein L210DRAFT_2268991 [Boletus edulis BED1]
MSITLNAPVSAIVPFLIGYTLCFTLMGALVVQAYIYFTRFADDRRTIKALVIVILLLEVFISAGVIVALGGLFVESATITPYAILVLSPMAGLVTTLTHGFYCWRIWTLRKSWLIPFPIIMVSLLQLASITIFALYDQLLPATESGVVFTNGAPSVSYTFSPWLVIWLGSSLACDLAITICMILSLRPSNSHFSSNKSTLVKLTRLTIETGLVTSVAALLELILGVVYEEHFYHIAVFFAISKLYANCLLASLNFRLVLKSQSDPNLTPIVWDNMASNVPSSRSGSQPSHVTQFVAWVETDVDGVVEMSEVCSCILAPVV